MSPFCALFIQPKDTFYEWFDRIIIEIQTRGMGAIYILDEILCWGSSDYDCVISVSSKDCLSIVLF